MIGGRKKLMIYLKKKEKEKKGSMNSEAGREKPNFFFNILVNF